MKNRIRLLVIDFDGTALGGYEPYARFPDKFSDFLDGISDKGIMWATCTTWHPFSQDRVFIDSRLKSRPVRLIGRTGLACGLYSGKELYLDPGWDLEMLSAKSEYGNNRSPAIRKFLKNSKLVESFEEERFEYIFTVKLNAGKTETADFVNDPVLKNHTDIIFNPDENTLTVYPYYMVKGTAVKKIQKQLGVSCENTIAAGDGTNDLSMMTKSIARFHVAPANADKQVKEAILRAGGVVSGLEYSDGVIDGVRNILRKCGQFV